MLQELAIAVDLFEDFRDPPQSADLAAVGGSAGRAVEAMLQNAIAHGSEVLARISKAALTRLLAGHPVSYQIAPQNLFTEAEQRELAEAFAAVGATSHLLGRALIRDWAKRVESKAAQEGLLESEDAEGHEHRGTGPGGGQFVGKGEGSQTKKERRRERRAAGHDERLRRGRTKELRAELDDHGQSMLDNLSAVQDNYRHVPRVQRRIGFLAQQIHAARDPNVSDASLAIHLSNIRRTALSFAAMFAGQTFADKDDQANNDTFVAGMRKVAEQSHRSLKALKELQALKVKESWEAVPAKDAERPPLKLHAYADWEADRAIMVGRIEGSVQPDDTPDPNELPDPFENPLADSPPGVPFKDIDPKRYDGAIRQLEYLCEVLEREGVQVYRPPVLPMSVAQADPVGLCATYVREVFAVIGTRAFLGMCQSPWRNKDADAIEPFLRVLNGGPVPRPAKGEWLEFGDVFRLGKDVMVCCSGQASGLAGAGWLQRQLGDEFKVWPVPIAPEWLHGDYVFSVVTEGIGLAHLPAFPNGFPPPLKGWDMIPVTREEVQGFGANVISLASDKMIFGQGEGRLAKELNRRGIEVIEVPFGDVEFWDGGLDCSTAELWIEG